MTLTCNQSNCFPWTSVYTGFMFGVLQPVNNLPNLVLLPGAGVAVNWVCGKPPEMDWDTARAGLAGLGGGAVGLMARQVFVARPTYS